MARQPNPAHRGLALAAVGLATFMTSLDNTVVNVALPSIQRDLRLSLGGLEWTASSYVLVFASLLLAGGRLADLYGRRRLFLAGTALFTAASLISGLATGESVLLAGRVLQGAGAALATPTTLAIISAMFPDARQRTRAAGAFAAAESRSGAPMADLALFRGRVFSGGTATLVLWGFGVLGVYFFTPLYLQGILGFSPSKAGLAFVPMALLMAASATVAPLVSGRAGTGR